MNNESVEFFTLRGKTLVVANPQPLEGKIFDNDLFNFVDSDGNKYHLIHNQSCCESVGLYETIGNIV